MDLSELFNRLPDDVQKYAEELICRFRQQQGGALVKDAMELWWHWFFSKIPREVMEGQIPREVMEEWQQSPLVPCPSNEAQREAPFSGLWSPFRDPLGWLLKIEARKQKKTDSAERFWKVQSGPQEGMIMSTTQVILVALVAVLVGAGLCWLRTLQKKEPAPRPSAQHQPPHPASSARPSVLVVAVNSGNKDLVETLRQRGVLDGEMADQLKKASEWLWFGDEVKFNDAKMADLFAQGDTSPSSEFDVYFVRLELSGEVEYRRYFDPSASLIDRVDGFHKLADQKAPATATVSNRRPKEDYENKGFFKM